MVKTVVRNNKNLIGHIMRGDWLMKEVMEGIMEDKRGPGRERISMIDDPLEKERCGDLKSQDSASMEFGCQKPGRTLIKKRHPLRIRRTFELHEINCFNLWLKSLF